MKSLLRLLFWGGLWFFAWVVTTLVRKMQKRPRMDNCLTWALRAWSEKNGYLVIRWCRSAKYSWMRWPHFLWLPEEHHVHLKHFMPKKEDQHMKIIPEMWFEGKILTGDSKDEMEN